jgi:Zn-finger nucleic acid-binding protein
MRYLTLLSIVLISVAGCSESDTESSNPPAVDITLTPVNQLCPIMGSAVTEDGGTVEFDGKLIGFCCPSCDGKWSKLSDTDKAAKLAAAHDGHDHDGHDHDGHDHDGHDDKDHEHGDGEKKDTKKDTASDE